MIALGGSYNRRVTVRTVKSIGVTIPGEPVRHFAEEGSWIDRYDQEVVGTGLCDFFGFFKSQRGRDQDRKTRNSALHHLEQAKARNQRYLKVQDDQRRWPLREFRCYAGRP